MLVDYAAFAEYRACPRRYWLQKHRGGNRQPHAREAVRMAMSAHLAGEPFAIPSFKPTAEVRSVASALQQGETLAREARSSFDRAGLPKAWQFMGTKIERGLENYKGLVLSAAFDQTYDDLNARLKIMFLDSPRAEMSVGFWKEDFAWSAMVSEMKPLSGYLGETDYLLLCLPFPRAGSGLTRKPAPIHKIDPLPLWREIMPDILAIQEGSWNTHKNARTNAGCRYCNFCAHKDDCPAFPINISEIYQNGQTN